MNSPELDEERIWDEIAYLDVQITNYCDVRRLGKILLWLAAAAVSGGIVYWVYVLGN